MKPLFFIVAFGLVLVSGCNNKSAEAEKIIREETIAKDEIVQRTRTKDFTSRFRQLKPNVLASITVNGVETGNANFVRVVLNKEYDRLALVQKSAVTKQVSGWWFKIVQDHRIRSDKAEVEFRDSTGKLAGSYKES